MARQGGPFAAIRQVPELDRPVEAARGKRLAVGAERHATDLPLMTGQRVLNLARGRVMDLDRAGVAAHGQRAAVRAERHRYATARLALEIAPLARGRVAQDQRTILSHRRQRLAVRAEGHAADPTGMPREGESHAPRVQVPEGYGRNQGAGGEVLAVATEGHATDQ